MAISGMLRFCIVAALCAKFVGGMLFRSMGGWLVMLAISAGMGHHMTKCFFG